LRFGRWTGGPGLNGDVRCFILWFTHQLNLWLLHAIIFEIFDEE